MKPSRNPFLHLGGEEPVVEKVCELVGCDVVAEVYVVGENWVIKVLKGRDGTAAYEIGRIPSRPLAHPLIDVEDVVKIPATHAKVLFTFLKKYATGEKR